MRWTRINKIRRYELATIRHPETTRNTTYRIVKGTSFKLAHTGGETIKYSVRAYVRNAPWSKEVSVNAFRRKRKAPGHTNPVAPPSGTAAPVTTTPVASSPVASQKLVVSVMNTTGWGVDSIFAKAGINATRLDIGEGSGIGLLKTAISHGMHPLPLYAEGSDGNLTDLTPAQCGADIAALVPQLKALGITTLEFGNESYLSESAATYGAQYNAAHIAAQGSGVKLLAAATTDSEEHARGGTGSWFGDLIKALPGGAGEIDALTLHPYGSMTSVNSYGYGWPMVATLHSEAVAAGISPTLPWYLTEVGQEVSGSGIAGQAPVSQSTQASDLTQYLNDIKAQYPWVVYFDWYSCPRRQHRRIRAAQQRLLPAGQPSPRCRTGSPPTPPSPTAKRPPERIIRTHLVSSGQQPDVDRRGVPVRPDLTLAEPMLELGAEVVEHAQVVA